MPHLHFYLPEAIARKVLLQAKARRMSVSQFLGELVAREVDAGWPPGYFEHVVGGWHGEPLERPPQADHEDREAMP